MAGLQPATTTTMPYSNDPLDFAGDNFSDTFTNPEWNLYDNGLLGNSSAFFDDQFGDASNFFPANTMNPQLLEEQTAQNSEFNNHRMALAMSPHQYSPTDMAGLNSVNQTYYSSPQTASPQTPFPESPNTLKRKDVHMRQDSGLGESIVNAPIVKRKRGPNKNKKTRTKEEEDKKREDFLTRNKIAAAKCRDRKKRQHQKLEAEAHKHKTEKPQLVADRDNLEQMVKQLIGELRSGLHICNDPEYKIAMTMRLNSAEATLQLQQVLKQKADDIAEQIKDEEMLDDPQDLIEQSEDNTTLSVKTEGRQQSIESTSSRISEVSAFSRMSGSSKFNGSNISVISESPQSFI